LKKGRAGRGEIRKKENGGGGEKKEKGTGIARVRKPFPQTSQKRKDSLAMVLGKGKTNPEKKNGFHWNRVTRVNDKGRMTRRTGLALNEAEGMGEFCKNPCRAIL